MTDANERATPRRRLAIVIVIVIIAVAAAISLTLYNVSAQRAADEQAAIAAEHLVAEQGCRERLLSYAAEYGALIEVAGEMRVRSLEEFARSPDALLFSADGTAVMSVDTNSAADVDRLVLEYSEQEELLALDGIHALAVSGTIVVNDESLAAVCLVQLEDGSIVQPPAVWLDIF